MEGQHATFKMEVVEEVALLEVGILEVVEEVALLNEGTLEVVKEVALLMKEHWQKLKALINLNFHVCQ